LQPHIEVTAGWDGFFNNGLGQKPSNVIKVDSDVDVEPAIAASIASRQLKIEDLSCRPVSPVEIKPGFSKTRLLGDGNSAKAYDVLDEITGFHSSTNVDLRPLGVNVPRRQIRRNHGKSALVTHPVPRVSTAMVRHLQKGHTVQLPELLLPAGNLSKLKMAIRYGADAVYAGASGFSMRPDGVSLDLAILAEAVRFTHDAGKKFYIAVNSLLFERDMPKLEGWLRETADIAFDAIILSDLGAFSLVRTHRPELDIHISTQMSVANSHSAGLLLELGAKRVILARECSIAEASDIAKATNAEIEVFVHGAMCMAISGRCLISAYTCGHNGSAGDCKQSCRWDWQLVERTRPDERFDVYEQDGQTVFLGSRDLCLIEHIPTLVQSGVCSLKVEGRMKSEYYAATVARAYREALDSYAADPEGYKYDPNWLAELEAVSHRPYGTGFAFGYPMQDPLSLQSPRARVSTHELVGYVHGIEAGRTLVEVKNPFRPGDELEWIAPNLPGGTVSVQHVWDEDGLPLERTVSARVVRVAWTDQPGGLPGHAILRRPK